MVSFLMQSVLRCRSTYLGRSLPCQSLKCCGNAEHNSPALSEVSLLSVLQVSGCAAGASWAVAILPAWAVDVLPAAQRSSWQKSHSLILSHVHHKFLAASQPSHLCRHSSSIAPAATELLHE